MSYKSQIPSTKFQTNSKPQILKYKMFESFLDYVFCLEFGAWDLEFGIRVHSTISELHSN
jgi:hypothetical protein